MNRILIKDATIINEGKRQLASVIISNKYIEKIFTENQLIENESQFNQVINAKGLMLIPGVIDDHVHFRDPGLTQKATLQTESKAAAAGGITSIMDMPNTTPHTTTLEAWNDKIQHYSKNSLVNYSCYFGASNHNVDILPQLNKHEVCGIKVFMGASTGNMLVDRIESLTRIFSNSDILVATHCENQDLIRKNTIKYLNEKNNPEDLDLIYHSLIRDEEVCYQSSKLAVELAQICGTQLHILHLSTAKELSLFQNNIPLEEKKITAEACISHLMFSDKDYSTLGTKIKCNPSIKTELDKEALRAAINSNVIDVIATDHAPHLLEDKLGGALKAASGIPIIQFSLLSMLSLVDQHILTLEKTVDKMCHAPAKIYQIHKRGFIREGYYADLVLLNPNQPWIVSPDKIESKCGWSPMENREFNWKVEKTLINGKIVYDNGYFDESNKGLQLKFR